MRRLTEDDMIGLEEEIRKRTSRIKLFLGSTRLTSDQAVRIVDAIKENLQMIERIDLSWNNISPTISYVTSLLGINGNTIQRLALKGVKMGDENIQKLFQIINEDGSSLTHLDISSNKINDVSLIAKDLSLNSTLECLYMGNMQMGNAGVRILLNALMNHKTLCRLTTGDYRNQLTQDTLRVLQDFVKKSPHVIRIDIFGALDSNEGMEALLETLVTSYRYNPMVITEMFCPKELALHFSFSPFCAAQGQSDPHYPHLSSQIGTNLLEQDFPKSTTRSSCLS
jgi:hypothetical protein